MVGVAKKRQRIGASVYEIQHVRRRTVGERPPLRAVPRAKAVGETPSRQRVAEPRGKPEPPGQRGGVQLGKMPPLHPSRPAAVIRHGQVAFERQKLGVAAQERLFNLIERSHRIVGSGKQHVAVERAAGAGRPEQSERGVEQTERAPLAAHPVGVGQAVRALHPVERRVKRHRVHAGIHMHDERRIRRREPSYQSAQMVGLMVDENEVGEQDGAGVCRWNRASCVGSTRVLPLWPLTPSEHAARTCVVVVTFNRPAMLRDSLDALAKQTVPFARIVVVDNASTDGETPGILDAYAAAEPRADVLRLPENLGASGGFAAGIEQAAKQGYDWIWTMDDDVLPAPDALEALFATGLADDPSTAALFSFEERSDGRPHLNPVGRYDRVRMAFVGKPLSRGGAPEAITYASFLGWLIRGDVARKELPRADFFIWHDDVEYSQRVLHHGAMWLVPASVIVHRSAETAGAYVRVRGRTITRSGQWRVYYGLRNRLLTLKAHAKSPAEYAAGVAWATFDLARSLGSTYVHYNGDPVRARLLVRGYLDGLRGRSGKRVEPGTGRYVG